VCVVVFDICALVSCFLYFFVLFLVGVGVIPQIVSPGVSRFLSDYDASSVCVAAWCVGVGAGVVGGGGGGGAFNLQSLCVTSREKMNILNPNGSNIPKMNE